jgi:Zn-finger protein
MMPCPFVISPSIPVRVIYNEISRTCSYGGVGRGAVVSFNCWRFLTSDNFVASTVGGQYDIIRNRQAMMTLLMDHRIEYTTKAQLAQHVRTVIIPKLFERKMVVYQPVSKTFQQCDEKSAIARVVFLMQGLPNKHCPVAPITAVSKRKLPMLRSRNKNDDSNHQQQKKQKLARSSIMFAKISEETDDGAKSEQSERTGKDPEPEPALAEEVGLNGNSESKGAPGDEVPLLLRLLNMDRSDEVYERLVELVNATKIPFHDCAFYPCTYEYEIYSRTDSVISHDLFGVAGPIFDKIRAFQAITIFLNVHFYNMMTSTDVEDYVASRIVPGLMDANVCRYDAEANEFVPLSFEDVAEIVIDPVNQMRQQIGMPTVDTAHAPPDNNASVTDKVKVTEPPTATAERAYAAPVQQPVVVTAEKRIIVFAMPKVYLGRIALSNKTWTPAVPGGVLPTRINLETDPIREKMARILTLQFDIPIHHCAFYPCKWHSKKCVCVCVCVFFFLFRTQQRLSHTKYGSVRCSRKQFQSVSVAAGHDGLSESTSRRHDQCPQRQGLHRETHYASINGSGRV